MPREVDWMVGGTGNFTPAPSGAGRLGGLVFYQSDVAGAGSFCGIFG